MTKAEILNTSFSDGSFQKAICDWYPDEYRILTNPETYTQVSSQRTRGFRSSIGHDYTSVFSSAKALHMTDNTLCRCWDYDQGLYRDMAYNMSIFTPTMKLPNFMFDPMITIYSLESVEYKSLVCSFMELTHYGTY